MASRRGRQVRPHTPRRGQDYAPIASYLGTFDFPVTAEVHGGVRRFRRSEGFALVETQRTILRQMNEAERQLPELLEKIRSCALASDPLALFSRLHVFDAMRRSDLPGSTMFGSDPLLEFYSGLVTAISAERVLSRLGTDDRPQVL